MPIKSQKLSGDSGVRAVLSKFEGVLEVILASKDIYYDHGKSKQKAN